MVRHQVLILAFVGSSPAGPANFFVIRENPMVGSVATNDLMVFTGNANPELARTIGRHLDIPMGIASVDVFSDGEISVEIGENVRGKDVFIIQPTCIATNDNLIELMLMIDALKRASPNRVTAVIPYAGSTRRDCSVRSVRVPFTR